mmetsp:Transcript_78563/g.197410  ORF Transcript_78563/g.197410 Transcript_78563/m.197410 type:complete len:226 (-) Transcript_78563:1007-1684(-)
MLKVITRLGQLATESVRRGRNTCVAEHCFVHVDDLLQPLRQGRQPIAPELIGLLRDVIHMLLPASLFRVAWDDRIFESTLHAPRATLEVIEISPVIRVRNGCVWGDLLAHARQPGNPLLHGAHENVVIVAERVPLKVVAVPQGPELPTAEKRGGDRDLHRGILRKVNAIRGVDRIVQQEDFAVTSHEQPHGMQILVHPVLHTLRHVLDCAIGELLRVVICRGVDA